MSSDTELMIEDCMKRKSKLTDWETGFMRSLYPQLSEKGFLSEKQLDTLDKIWERIT